MTSSRIDVNLDLIFWVPWLVLRIGHVMLTLPENLIPILFVKEFVDSKLLFLLFTFFLLVCLKFVLSLWTMHFWSLKWVFYTRFIVIFTCNCNLLVKNNFFHPFSFANSSNSGVTAVSVCNLYIFSHNSQELQIWNQL